MNSQNKAKITSHHKKTAIHIAAWVLVSLALALASFLLFINLFYADKFLPNTKIGGVAVAGLKQSAARELIYTKLADLNHGIKFYYQDFSKTFTPEEIGIEIFVNETVEQAMAKQNSFDLPFKSLGAFWHLVAPLEQDVIYSVDQDRLLELMAAEFDPLGTPKTEGTLIASEVGYTFVPGSPGTSLDKKHLIALIDKRVKNLDATPLTLPFAPSYPEITAAEIQNARAGALIIANKNLTLNYQEKNWTLTPDIFASWIVFTPQENSEKALNYRDYAIADNFDLNNLLLGYLTGPAIIGQHYNKMLGATIDREAVGDYLASKVMPNINIKPQNARFAMKDGSLELLSDSTPGLEVLVDDTYANIQAAIISDAPQAAIATREVGAQVSAGNIKQLGIKEMIGQGESNFAGSPQNRIHNISVAAEKLNGILIAPGEEFSLVEAIGEVNAEAGYLPELVIKEKKTIPEYGGGLCQIATTVFRGAMQTGLDITERQSHAYAVDYYAPQGTDATIYIPHPDLRFINDTKDYILLQSKIEGSALTFDFYGTNDGRQIELSGPVTWDHKSDGSLKAKWGQKVTMPDGTVRENEFYSNYKPPAEFHDNN